MLHSVMARILLGLGYDTKFGCVNKRHNPARGGVQTVLLCRRDDARRKK